jgi:membrane protein YdbS with pleckstrin-like domain
LSSSWWNSHIPINDDANSNNKNDKQIILKLIIFMSSTSLSSPSFLFFHLLFSMVDCFVVVVVVVVMFVVVFSFHSRCRRWRVTIKKIVFVGLICVCRDQYHDTFYIREHGVPNSL